ncbi:MAG: aldehyde ferredoxin oxidoreductase family protein [Thermoplasmata archaeon]
MKGFAGGVLKVDLTSGVSEKSALPSPLAERFLGGTGLAARFLYDCTKPRLDAFDPANMLILAPGLFNGFPVPTGGKVLFCAKSPLTGTIGEAVMGARIGTELKRAGYDLLLVSGKSDSPSYLFVDDMDVEIRNAEDLWGKDTRETAEAIRKDEGDAVVATIGIAGENLVRYACIDCEDRQSGRGGLGAVMGSKNLKAIAVKGSGDLVPKDAGRLMDLCLDYHERMIESAAFGDDTRYGTGEFLEWMNAEKGTFPTRNWREGVFDDREKIDPHYWAPIYTRRNNACFACTKPCGRIFRIDKGKYAGLRIDGIEYELLYSLGGLCGMGEIEELAKANELCDLYGLDGISAGASVAFAMDLFESGILTKDDTGGIDLEFGNPEAELKLIEMIANREGLGDVLAEGVKRASERIGKGAEDYAVHVKGMEPPAYDVRGIKGMALAFMTSSRGACHLRSCAYGLELTGRFWKFEGVDRFATEGKGIEIKELEDLMTVYDVLGVCKFSRGFFFAEGFIDILDSITGLRFSESGILKVGERVNNLKHMFNLREGITRDDFRLPKRILTLPIPDGESKGHLVTGEEMRKMLDDYFMARGWSEEGLPSEERIKELDLV